MQAGRTSSAIVGHGHERRFAHAVDDLPTSAQVSALVHAWWRQRSRLGGAGRNIVSRPALALCGSVLLRLYEAVTGPAAVFHLKVVPDVPPISPATQNWLVVPGWGAAAL